jgi:hypothetical protein
MQMHRRRFIATGLATSGLASSAAGVGNLWAQGGSALSGRAAVQVRVHPDEALGEIPSDFMGLGYEISAVAKPGLMSGKNAAYVQFVRTLGARGVIRIGGNTSDYATFTQSGDVVSAPKATVVNERSIRDLATFLDATGWQLIWGLNLGRGTIDQAVTEAQVVANATGKNLLAIEIGNEPDLFDRNQTHRPAPYGYPQFLADYRKYKAAIREKLPGVPLAGPDAANKTDWLTEFARDEGSDLRLLTQHYYSEGPPQNPASTIETLMHPGARLSNMLASCRAASKASGIPYRICETNSCFGGGKPGVSDTLASALWVLDYLHTIAAADGAGANIETDVNHLGFISYYTPIWNDNGAFSAKPIYYGMLAFLLGSTGNRIRADLDAADLNVKAYSVRTSNGLAVTVINKEASRNARVRIETQGSSSRASAVRLEGPSLESKTGVTLARSSVADSGTWKPAHEEELSVREGICEVKLKPASAAVVTFPS